MEEFLKKEVPLVNKNRILDVHIGSRVSDHVFNTTISTPSVQAVIRMLTRDHKCKQHCSKEHVYVKRNEHIVLKNNEQDYVVHQSLHSEMFTNASCNVIKLIRGEYPIPSYSTYDNILYLEIVEYTVHNIMIKIALADDMYTISLRCAKPNKVATVLNLIQTIGACIK